MDIATCEYRSLRILRIKDETRKVNEKHRRNQALGNHPEALRPTHDVVNPVPENLPIPLEATALGYFFSIFSRSGTFAYLPEFSSSLVKDDTITQALCASALGSMALQHRDNSLLRMARQYYARSLAETNRLLSKSETAVLDSTLLCVLLLSAFEALCFHNGGDPGNWTAHIRGSSQLLLLRGKRQFQSPFGILLFHHAGVSVLIDAITHHTSISPALDRLFDYATSSVPGLDSVSKSIMSLLWRIAVVSPNMRNITAKEALRETFELHDQVKAFREDLLEMAPFQVVHTMNGNHRYQEAHSIHTFEGVMHQYQDQQEARLHNASRLINLGLLESMFSVLKNDSDIESFIQYPDMDCARDWTTEKILVESAELVRDILASVPYYLDLLEPQHSIEARYLIWPLTSIISLDVCPPLARHYIQDRLMALGYKYNMRQAIEVATMLDQRDHVQKW